MQVTLKKVYEIPAIFVAELVISIALFFDIDGVYSICQLCDMTFCNEHGSAMIFHLLASLEQRTW